MIYTWDESVCMDIFQTMPYYTQKSPEWDWNDDAFCHDITSEWSGIEISDIYPGIGRLLHETQDLTDIMILWYVKHYPVFRKQTKNAPDYEATQEQLESCSKIQDIRNSTLGYLVNVLLSSNVLEDECDVNKIREILNNRNYFVHEFFSELDDQYTIEDLNRDVRRLKKAINTVVKFNQKYYNRLAQGL